MKQLEMMRMFYFTQKIVVLVVIVGFGNIVFVRQLKLIWQNQKLNVEKNSLREAIISIQALCLYFTYYLRIWDVLLNCMRNLRMKLLNYILWTQENISSMDKKKEMIVKIFFLGNKIINEARRDEIFTAL
jgi:hypothetical protein